MTRGDACAFLDRFAFKLPPGCSLNLPQLVAAGQAYEFSSSNGRLVYVLQQFGTDLWITAAAGTTQRGTRTALQLIELQARLARARRVCFQTARPGLMRLAMRSGYQREGWTFTKEIPNG